MPDRPAHRSRGVVRLSAALVCALGAAIIVACTHSGPRASETAPAADSPDAIIAHYYRAIGFDSLTWEYGFQTGKMIIDTGAAADAGRRGAEFDESFVDAASKGHQVSLVGAERFADRPSHRLRVSLADGWEKEYVFDDSTGLIVALRKAMPVHATGAPVTSVTVYDDWRAEGGVLQPHRFIERELQTNRLMSTLQWDSIRTNIDLGERELGRPAH